MTADRITQIAHLEGEAAALRAAIAALVSQPDLRQLLEAQLEAKERTLAALRASASAPERSHVQQIGGAHVGVADSGDVQGAITHQPGISYGTNNTIPHIGDVVQGDKVLGDKVDGNKIINQLERRGLARGNPVGERRTTLLGPVAQ